MPLSPEPRKRAVRMVGPRKERHAIKRIFDRFVDEHDAGCWKTVEAELLGDELSIPT